ncbi:MAG: hypothetical protein QM705_05530 [Ancrocorticia sp.]
MTRVPAAGQDHGKNGAQASWLTSVGEAVLVAASNRGTFRRAGKLAASGTTEMVSGDATQATFVVDGARVQLFPGGPNQARCDCPVAATCVHIISAYVWARENDAAVGQQSDTESESSQSESGPSTMGRSEAGDQIQAETSPHPAPNKSESLPKSDPLADVLGWDIAAANKAAGIAAVRVVAAEAPVTDVSVLVSDGSLTVSWPSAGLNETGSDSDSPTVVILPGLGLPGMVVSGRYSEAHTRVWRLRALVGVYTAHGREWEWPAEVATSDRVSLSQRQVAADVITASDALVGRGISRLGGESIHALSRLSERAALEDLRLLGRLGAATAAKLRALHERDDHTTESMCLAALAEVWALATLIQQAETELPPQLLGGRFREGDKANLGPLVPLAARWWHGSDGSRGFSWYALDTASGEVESVTTGRSAGSDPGFHASWTSPLVWGASGQRLCEGIIRLSGAERREDGALAATVRTRVERVSQFGWLNLEDLAAQVNQCSSGLARTAFGTESERLRLVLPRKQFGMGVIEVDEVAQELLWSITDSSGITYRLALPANESNARKLSWLASSGKIRAITMLGNRPEAAFVAGKDGLELISLTLTPLDHGKKGNELWRKLLGRNKERVARTRESTGLQRLLLSVRDILEAIASTGTQLPERTQETLRTSIRELDDLGLSSLADALRELTHGPGDAIRASSGEAIRASEGTPHVEPKQPETMGGKPDPVKVLWAAFILGRTETLAE